MLKIVFVEFYPDKTHVANYNMPFLYRLSSNHTLSIQQLRHALQLIINKHQSLRTSLVFDTEKNLLMQRIIDQEDNKNNLFTFIESTYETDEQLNNIIHDEQTNSQHFDLTQGLVFRCHIVYYKQISSNDLLSNKDVLIFNFHHALFDFHQWMYFLMISIKHIQQVNYLPMMILLYVILIVNINISFFIIHYLYYLDAIIEQQMPMTGASMFWLDTLHDCNLDQSIPLPYDRYRLSR